eukprot:g4299.t1
MGASTLTKKPVKSLPPSKAKKKNRKSRSKKTSVMPKPDKDVTSKSDNRSTTPKVVVKPPRMSKAKLAAAKKVKRELAASQNPCFHVANKRYRAAKKKWQRILDVEASIAEGKEVDTFQKQMLAGKGQAKKVLELAEKMKEQVFEAAIETVISTEARVQAAVAQVLRLILASRRNPKDEILQTASKALLDVQIQNQSQTSTEKNGNNNVDEVKSDLDALVAKSSIRAMQFLERSQLPIDRRKGGCTFAEAYNYVSNAANMETEAKEAVLKAKLEAEAKAEAERVEKEKKEKEELEKKNRETATDVADTAAFDNQKRPKLNWQQNELTSQYEEQIETFEMVDEEEHEQRQQLHIQQQPVVVEEQNQSEALSEETKNNCWVKGGWDAVLNESNDDDTNALLSVSTASVPIKPSKQMSKNQNKKVSQRPRDKKRRPYKNKQQNDNKHQKQKKHNQRNRNALRGNGRARNNNKVKRNTQQGNNRNNKNGGAQPKRAENQKKKQ